jgi:hypothetical protein
MLNKHIERLVAIFVFLITYNSLGLASHTDVLNLHLSDNNTPIDSHIKNPKPGDSIINFLEQTTEVELLNASRELKLASQEPISIHNNPIIRATISDLTLSLRKVSSNIPLLMSYLYNFIELLNTRQTLNYEEFTFICFSILRIFKSLNYSPDINKELQSLNKQFNFVKTFNETITFDEFSDRFKRIYLFPSKQLFRHDYKSQLRISVFVYGLPEEKYLNMLWFADLLPISIMSNIDVRYVKVDGGYRDPYSIYLHDISHAEKGLFFYKPDTEIKVRSLERSIYFAIKREISKMPPAVANLVEKLVFLYSHEWLGILTNTQDIRDIVEEVAIRGDLKSEHLNQFHPNLKNIFTDSQNRVLRAAEYMKFIGAGPPTFGYRVTDHELYNSMHFEDILTAFKFLNEFEFNQCNDLLEDN